MIHIVSLINMRKYSSQQKKRVKSVRSDAQHNYSRIIVAARKEISKNGPDISLSSIIKSAKVSRATFYRNFATKQALVNAIFHYNLDLLIQYADKINEKDTAFFLLLETVIQQNDVFHPLISFVDRSDRALLEKLKTAFEPSVTKAKRAHLIRQDFSIDEDLSLLITMVGGAYTYAQSDQQNNAISQRAIQLLMEGIRK